MYTSGGVIAYIRDKYNCNNRTDIQTADIESLWIEILLENTSPLLICFLYRPPDSPTDWYDKFQAEVECASSFSSNIILIGDLNIDFLKPLSQIWQNILESFGLCQRIKEPTRISNRSATLNRSYLC